MADKLAAKLRSWRGDKVRFAEEGLRISLHEKQKEWLTAGAQFKTGVWGRRGGKTFVESVDALHVALTNPETFQFNIAITQDQAMIGFRKVERMASALSQYLKMDLFAEEPKHSPFGKIMFINGSEYHARTGQHEGKYLRGHAAHVARIDEAGIMPDRTVAEAIEPMLTDWDGQLVKIGTPWGRNHLLRSFEEGQPDEKSGLRKRGYFSLHCPTWDNPHVSRAYIERMRKRLSSIQFAVEYGAEFMDDLGRVFPWSLIESCYSKREYPPLVPTEGHTYVLGADLAKHLDWTVIYVLDITDRDHHFIVWKTRFQKEPWEKVILSIKEAALTWRIAGGMVDASGAGDPVMERLSDLPLESYKGAIGPKLELINTLKVAMERGRIAWEWDEDLARELRYYAYELSTRSGRVIMGTQREHDDTVVALALAEMAASRMFSEVRIGLVGFDDEREERRSAEESIKS
jgi:hypothetical protein